jgi:hypothetical protein
MTSVDGERVTFEEIGLDRVSKPNEINNRIKSFVTAKLDFYPVNAHSEISREFAIPTYSASRKQYKRFIWRIVRNVRADWNTYLKEKGITVQDIGSGKN